MSYGTTRFFRYMYHVFTCYFNQFLPPLCMFIFYDAIGPCYTAYFVWPNIQSSHILCNILFPNPCKILLFIQMWIILQNYFPKHVQVMFLLQPKGFFQRAFSDMKTKFIKEELEYKVQISNDLQQIDQVNVSYLKCNNFSSSHSRFVYTISLDYFYSWMFFNQCYVC